ENGIWVSPGSASNVIVGNYIGTNVAGDAALGNRGAGVLILGPNDNQVGRPNPEDRKLLSGNRGDGVFITSSSLPLFVTGNRVQNNYIGTDAQGTAPLGNGSAGVNLISADITSVGGTAAGARNVISGNNGTGVHIDGSGSTGNHVEGNYIGVDASGGENQPAPHPLPRPGGRLRLGGGRSRASGAGTPP